MQNEKVRDEQRGLSEVDGVLCVSDVSCVSETKVHRVHWPTNLTRRDLCRFFGKEIDLSKVKVIPSNRACTGEYAIYPDYELRGSVVHWGQATTICLKDRGQTKPIRCDHAKHVYPPKTKRETMWKNNHFEYYTKTNGWQVCDNGFVTVEWEPIMEGGAS